MSLREIALGSGGSFLILLTLIQIAPIHINPWSWILGGIGKAVNKDLSNKIDSLDTKVGTLEGTITQLETKISNVETKINSMNAKITTLEGKFDSLETKVDTLEVKVDEFERKSGERDIILCRARMLRFGDEILHGQRHSKDHFDQILLDCTDYINYCNTHPGFMNNITEHTIDLINATYDKCLEEKSFL